MPNHYLSVLYNENVALKVCVCVGEGGGGGTCPLAPPLPTPVIYEY